MVKCMASRARLWVQVPVLPSPSLNYCGLNCATHTHTHTPDSHIRALRPHVRVFGDGAFDKSLAFDEGGNFTKD